jgi:hypothetical protein
MARPRWLLASRSMRPLRTIAAGVNLSSTHCRLGLAVQRLPGRRRGRMPALVPSAARARWNRWPVRRRRASRWGDGVQDGGGDADDRAAFEFGVVLDADPGQGGDLAAAQPGHSPGADVGHPRLLWGDLGSPRDQELADLGTVVHTVDATPDAASGGMPY